MLLSIACSLLFPTWLIRPIRALNVAAVRLIQGDLSPIVQERLFVETATGLLLRRQVITRALAD